MPLGALKTWAADEDFLASDINGNFTVIKNKFSETAGVGIVDGDCASDMGLNGNKLSNASGKQVPTDRLAPNAVDRTILRSDASVDANRAVTPNHVANEAIEKRAVKLASLTKAQTAIAVQTKAFGPTASTLAHGFESVVPVLVNNAGNYRVELQCVVVGFFSPVYANTVQIIPVDPTTPIPVATNLILDVRLVALSGLCTTSLSGTVEIVSIPNT